MDMAEEEGKRETESEREGEGERVTERERGAGSWKERWSG
jgi:hypothetical protein